MASTDVVTDIFSALPLDLLSMVVYVLAQGMPESLILLLAASPAAFRSVYGSKQGFRMMRDFLIARCALD
eukprot:3690021-Rhodomonas_salina.1